MTEVLAREVAGVGGPVPVHDHLPPKADRRALPLVWIHGGGFSNGGLQQRESEAPAEVWATRGRFVRTVGYRLARRPGLGQRSPLATLPNRYPAGLDDVVAAVRDLMHQEQPVLVGGASAGACLAAATVLRLRDDGETLPSGLVLAYGTFHAELPQDAAVERELHGVRRLLFGPAMVRRMNQNYVGDERLLRPGTAFPGGADLSGFPPTLLLDADNDRLRASGTAFARELRAAGATVQHEVLLRSGHGFLNAPRSAAFRDGVDRIDRWLRHTDRHDTKDSA